MVGHCSHRTMDASLNAITGPRAPIRQRRLGVALLRHTPTSVGHPWVCSSEHHKGTDADMGPGVVSCTEELGWGGGEGCVVWCVLCQVCFLPAALYMFDWAELYPVLVEGCMLLTTSPVLWSICSGVRLVLF